MSIKKISAFILSSILACFAVHASAGERPAFPKDRVTKELQVTTEDGLKLAAWQLAAVGAPRGNVVIIHGLKDYSERYLDFAKQLSEAGYQVFAFDLRGHARSEGDAVFFPKMETIMNDVSAAFKVFRQDDNQKPWFLFGHSAGAAIATRYAVDHPGELAGYLISAPALKPSADLSGFLIGALKFVDSIAPSLRMVDLPNEKFSKDAAVVASMENDPLMCNCKLPARTGVELLGNMDYIAANRSKVNTPFFIFHGDHDEINNIEGTREFYAGTGDIQGKVLKIYPGLWHDLLHEPERQLVVSDIIEWINLQAAKNQKAG